MIFFNMLSASSNNFLASSPNPENVQQFYHSLSEPTKTVVAQYKYLLQFITCIACKISPTKKVSENETDRIFFSVRNTSSAVLDQLQTS